MEENEKKDEEYAEQPLAKSTVWRTVPILLFLLAAGLILAGIILWAMSGDLSTEYRDHSITVALILIGAGFAAVILGLLFNGQAAYLYEDRVEIFYFFSHYTLRIRDITSAGSGFLGYLKIGTSSYHWRFFLFMSRAYPFHNALNDVLEERDSK